MNGYAIPMEEWGRDHKSTILYAESRVVDHKGKLDSGDPRMRVDGMRYPTRLKDGKTVYGHTDYDCLFDAEKAGLLSYDGEHVTLTKDGWAYVLELRKERAGVK